MFPYLDHNNSSSQCLCWGFAEISKRFVHRWYTHLQSSRRTCRSSKLRLPHLLRQSECAKLEIIINWAKLAHGCVLQKHISTSKFEHHIVLSIALHTRSKHESCSSSALWLLCFLLFTQITSFAQRPTNSGPRYHDLFCAGIIHNRRIINN